MLHSATLPGAVILKQVRGEHWMRNSILSFVIVLFVAGCGSKGGLYLPDGETEEVAPVSMERETFQPETRQQELQSQPITQEEEEDE